MAFKLVPELCWKILSLSLSLFPYCLLSLLALAYMEEGSSVCGTRGGKIPLSPLLSLSSAAKTSRHLRQTMPRGKKKKLLPKPLKV